MRPTLVASLLCSVLAGCARSPDCPPSEVPQASAVSQTTESTPADEPAAEPAAAPMVIMLVRHAEKAKDGTPDPPLTERGVRRAQCLARLLDGFGPTHLFATQYQRTAATIAPLAEASGISVTTIEAQDGPGWGQALGELPAGARVVIAGHSNTLPALVSMLGGQLDRLDPKGNIPDDDYDRLVHVVHDGSRLVASYTTGYCTE